MVDAPTTPSRAKGVIAVGKRVPYRSRRRKLLVGRRQRRSGGALRRKGRRGRIRSERLAAGGAFSNSRFNGVALEVQGRALATEWRRGAWSAVRGPFVCRLLGRLTSERIFGREDGRFGMATH